MKVVLAGASGLIGTALAQSLIADGHVVRSLVRRSARQAGEVEWHPGRADLDPAILRGVDAVVCLSGAGIGSRRWTSSYKQTIRASRLDSVGTLARTIAAGGGKPVFVCASAIGYYGDTGDRTVDETAPCGSGFVAQLCRDWEAAADPARHAGTRVVHLRSGIVLDRRGGLLGRLRPIALLGVAGRLGSGRQFMSWISLADEVSAIRFLIESDVEGPVNLTAPNPVRNGELISAVARMLKRPAAIPVPAIALRIALGEFSAEVLGGQRVLPARLAAAGFDFQHETLDDALRATLSPAGA